MASMGQAEHEPSMEDILASIKRIIAEDGEPAARANSSASELADVRSDDDDDDDDAGILELTQPLGPAPGSFAAVFAQASATPPGRGADTPSVAETAMSDADTTDRPEIVSPKAADASRQALAALSAMVVRPEAGANTLEGLVGELLRPMLREWLDAELPAIVERLVSGEIARISGRPG